ncbi:MULTISPECIES: hypothetical protein [Persicobacter]|uniref:Uncharacterized protein n=1 Tax=Persicobacter diffluens TaxID=981 RepID=A0AAN5AJU4_9BACT|nr:hypothetical protein [Persicobacter sp. CCB-QB2]GJM59816.1 hypothetical protein PEDI_03680 [Persicobacter diffluens]
MASYESPGLSFTLSKRDQLATVSFRDVIEEAEFHYLKEQIAPFIQQSKCCKFILDLSQLTLPTFKFFHKSIEEFLFHTTRHFWCCKVVVVTGARMDQISAFNLWMLQIENLATNMNTDTLVRMPSADYWNQKCVMKCQQKGLAGITFKLPSK